MRPLMWLFLFDDIVADKITLQMPNLKSSLGKLVFFVAAVGLVAAIYHAYRREPDYLPRERRWTLAALRSAAALLLLFVMTGAFLDLSRRESSQGTLCLLFDVSRSMSLVDKRLEEADLNAAAKVLGLRPGSIGRKGREQIDRTSRLDLVKAALANSGMGILESLRSIPGAEGGGGYKIEAFTFGARGEATPLDLAPDDADGGPLAGLPPPADEGTRLGGPLRDALRRLKGHLVAGVVPFTDGAWNRGEDPLIAAEDLGVPVYPVGVGLPQTKDIEIPFIFAENLVFKGDTFPMYVRMKQRGYAGRSATLVVRRDDQADGEVVKRETVEFDKGTEWTHTVEITPGEEGTFAFVASIEPFEDEMSAENNAETCALTVIDKKINVLVVEDSPRWEFRFLKTVLELDRKRIAPTFVVRQADGDLVRQRGSEFEDAFPATPSELRRYNLIVLGNITSDFFTRGELDNLERYVRTEGGALLAIAGRNHMPDSYKDTPVEDLLPVEFQPQPEWRASDENIRSVTHGFRPELTPEGKRSMVLRFSAEPSENEELWESLSDIYWFYPAERLKPAATALLVHPIETARKGPMPVVAHHRYGKGRVMYFGTDETWRWRYEPGAEYHRRLWGQVVTFLSMAHLLGEANRVQIETDRAEYAVGDRARIIARILDTDFKASLAESVTAVVSFGEDQGAGGAGLDREVTLSPVKDQPGMFQGEFTAPAEGRYRVVIKGEEDEAEHCFSAASPRIEFDNPGMRRELLEQIAEVSRGEFLELHEAERLSEFFSAKRHELEPRREERPLWNAPGLMILIAVFLGAEWFIRKRSDLM